MKTNNRKIYLILFILIIILFFCIHADNKYKNPKLFQDVAKASGEMNTYPYLQYEKHLQSTMLVKITGPYSKKKGA